MGVQYLWSFHYFRAFAILNIVILHLWVLPDGTSQVIQNQLIFKELFFHASTIYFIFISGFLVMHLKERITTKAYYKSKIRNVFLPFAIISVSLIIVYSSFGSVTQEINQRFFIDSIKSILYGKVNFHFWYIPFISLIFLVTPFLLKIDKKVFLYMSPLLLLLPLLGTRTGTEITFGQYLYFFPIYILGMVIRLYLDTIKQLIKRFYGFVLFGFFLSFILLFWLLKDYDFQHSYPFFYESVFYINRLFVIFMFIRLSRKISSNKYPIIGKIADVSFALYFIHGAIGIFLQPIYFNYFQKVNEIYWIPFSVLITFSIILLCLIIIRVTKLIFGKWSRYLIGY